MGSGHAVVFSNGSMVEGTWNRPSISSQYALIGPDSKPIQLTPGRTWIELTPGATSSVLSPETASGLLSSGR